MLAIFVGPVWHVGQHATSIAHASSRW
jgi:hypothetical protein